MKCVIVAAPPSFLFVHFCLSPSNKKGRATREMSSLTALFCLGLQDDEPAKVRSAAVERMIRESFKFLPLDAFICKFLFCKLTWKRINSYRAELGYEVGPRLRELMLRGQRKSGGGIHAT